MGIHHDTGDSADLSEVNPAVKLASPHVAMEVEVHQSPPPILLGRNRHC